MATTNSVKQNANFEVIEQVLERLKTESRFSLPVEKRHATNSIDSRFNTPSVRSAFRDLVLDGFSVENLEEVYLDVESQPSNHALMSVSDRAAALIVGLDNPTFYNLVSPSRGDFDWDKTDWESRDAEVEAFTKHVERVIFKTTNYRIGYGEAVSV